MAIKKHERDALRELRTEIRLHPAGDFSIEQLSRRLSMDRNKLCSGFKKLYSKSIHQFVIRSRMKMAKRLLKHSELPIKAISVECGYRNVKNFHTAFKRIVGKTPLQYKRT